MVAFIDSAICDARVILVGINAPKFNLLDAI